MKLNYIHLLLVATLPVPIITLTLPAHAQPERPGLPGSPAFDIPDVAAPGVFDGPNAAELRDLAYIADEQALPLDQVIGRYGWGRNFSMLVGLIARSHPLDYAGAAIERDGSAWIAFAAEPPADARRLVEEFDRRVLQSGLVGKASTEGVAIIASKGFSEAELNAEVVKVHQSVYGQVAGIEDVTTSYDQETGEIRMSIIASEGEADLVSSMVKELVGPRVDVSLVDGPVADDEATHLGGQPTTTCTAGFVVVNPTLGRGMSTAAHCQDQQSMNGIALDYIIAHNGQHGDMQWHRKVGQTFPDDFLAGAQNTWNADQRDVAAVGTPVVGLYLFKNGKMTFRDGDYVKELGHCVNGACNLVRVYEDQTVGGDSGAPYFVGNTAYGIHKGDNVHDWAVRDVFTRADAFWAMSAAVATA